MISLRLSRDVSRNRALFQRGLYGDKWVGDHHAFWIATDPSGEAAGFCSVVLLPREHAAFLSSAAVFRGYRGCGLQRRMIRLRLRWAKRHGARYVVTYAKAHNWESVSSLIRTGFKAYEPSYPWVGNGFWYFQRAL